MKGELIIIGGHEDKENGQGILTQVAERTLKGGKLVIVTVATQEPKAIARDYQKVFKKLGVEHIEQLDIRTREDAHDEKHVSILKAAKVIFFTGGDQLRITSQLGDSPVFCCMQERFQDGTVFVGTSAGAAAMPTTMVIFRRKR